MKANGTPLFPEVGLLALPYHRFDWPWMTPHHVLTRLANYFRVLWLEPAHHWRDAASCKTRQNDIARLTHTLPSSFNIYVPEPWLPKMYRPTFARQALAQARVRRAWRQLREQGCEQLVLHLWHHQFEAALNVGAHQVSLYHIDDEYSFLPEPGPMEARESRVIHAVDRVFAISPGLMERKGGINPRMTFAPEGVDYRLYSTPVPEPADIAHIPHPRVGYTGILKPSLNWRLLANLARRHPHWSFVFVGARNMDKNGNDLLDELAGLKNVYLLGRKSVWDLAAYPQHFDVCIMPYEVNGYTNNIYPLKLHEYLASGRPIVATPIRSLHEFRDVITIADSDEEWSTGLSRALAPSARCCEAARARQAIARRYDWSEIVYGIARSVCEHLGADYLRQLRQLRFDTTGRSLAS